MHVVYYGPYSALGGYGRACRDYVAALARHRPDVQLTVVDITSAQATAGLGRAPDAEPRFRALDRLVREDASHVLVVEDGKPAPVVVLVHATPDALTLLARQERVAFDAPARVQNGALVPFWRGQAPIVAMTTFDATPPPPLLPLTPPRPVVFDPAWRYAGLIVPSQFAERNVPWTNTPVVVVPHAYDPGLLPPTTVRPGEPGELVPGWFVFYSIGVWGERKNMLGVLRAYLAAFSLDDRVQLHLHIPDANTPERMAMIKGVIASSGIPKDRQPVVTISHGYQSEAALEEIHTRGDCFVSASRGEAWNLPLFEAAARDKRIVAPDVGPHMDYLAEVGGCQYAAARHDQVTAGLEIMMVNGRPAMTVAMPHGLSCRHTWADPSIRSLAEAMRRTHADRDQAGIIDRAAAFAPFTYPRVADQLVATLQNALTDFRERT